MIVIWVVVMMVALNSGHCQAQIPDHLSFAVAHTNIDATGHLPFTVAHTNVDATNPVNNLSPELTQLATMLSGKYVCGGFELVNVLRYINQSELCNNISQCPLGDDESMCTTSTTSSTPSTTTTVPTTTSTTTTTTSASQTVVPACQNGFYRCNADPLQCIPRSEICNGVINCPAGEDEQGCPITPVCQNGFYRCNANPLNCIPRSEVCNGANNCPAGDDEQGCPVTCSKAQYRCDSDPVTCISKSQVCDGTNNCPFGDDENNCPTPGCDLDHIWCRLSTGQYSCAKRCDGNIECYNGIDETVDACNCRNGTVACLLTNHQPGCATMCNNLISGTPAECRDPTVDEPHSSCACPDGQIRCTLTGGMGDSCATYCDGIRECDDGSDEANTTCAGKCDDLHLWCLRTSGTYGCATRCNQVKECTLKEDEMPGVCRYPDRAACEDGWFPFGAGKRCYHYDDEYGPDDVFEAIDCCTFEHNSSILTVESKAEHDFLTLWDDHIFGFNVWMGITDEGTEGVWRNIKTGEPITYLNFRAGEDNDATKNCAVFDDDGWRIRACDEDRFDILCEKGQDDLVC